MIKLQSLLSNSRQLSGGGRTASAPDMEEALAAWINEQKR